MENFHMEKTCFKILLKSSCYLEALNPTDEDIGKRKRGIIFHMKVVEILNGKIDNSPKPC